MARRSDHTRDQLRDLILTTAHRHLGEVGIEGFSAARVAREIGYSVATLHVVVGDHVDLVMALNTRTFGLWADDLEKALEKAGPDRLAVLVEAYFAFAHANRKLWKAIYIDLPYGRTIPAEQEAARGLLTGIVVREIAATLPMATDETVRGLANSLVATVHGHCDMWITGSLQLMGATDPVAMSMDRVREAIAAAG